MQQMMMSQRRGLDGMMGGVGGYGGRAGLPSDKKKTGKDVRNVNRKEERTKVEQSAEENRAPSLSDPYFNIVQVKVYGQARFFNAPPADAAPAASTADAAATAA